MSLKKFRTYQLSVDFYHHARTAKVPQFLKDQLNRASSSICLNLSEGSAKATPRDRHRYYRSALGSQRECISILDLSIERDENLYKLCDELGGHIYKLVKSERI